MSYNKLHYVLIYYEALTNDSMKLCNLKHHFNNKHKECCDKASTMEQEEMSIARQLHGENVSAAANQHTTIEELP
jgi:hypothetical protein